MEKILKYFTGFEKAAQLYKVPKGAYMKCTPNLKKGKLFGVFNSLPVEDNIDFNL